MAEAMDTLPDTPSLHEKHIRITQHGKMKSWISASLQFLQTPESTDKSLTFHTLPNPTNTPPDPEHPPNPTHPADPAHPPETKPITPHTASLSTSVVPRLISVVEILKREYIKLLETTKSPRLIGLHQYNELGTLEALGVVVDRTAGAVGSKEPGAAGGKEPGDGANGLSTAEERRASEIIQALSGKNHPKQIQTPFMRITLSMTERPDLLAQGASYQPPAVRKQSKAAKARAKKQRAKAKRAIDTAASDAKTKTA